MKTTLSILSLILSIIALVLVLTPLKMFAIPPLMIALVLSGLAFLIAKKKNQGTKFPLVILILSGLVLLIALVLSSLTNDKVTIENPVEAEKDSITVEAVESELSDSTLFVE